MYGAGSIGRGFIGQILHDSGYHVVFVDVNAKIVDALNKEGRYTQVTVGNGKTTERIIDNVRAVNGKDTESVLMEIADCDLMAVSVGASVVKQIIPLIAEGISKRMEQHLRRSLNILICENIKSAHIVLRDMLCSAPGFDAGYLNDIGLVRTTLGRMVPVMSNDMPDSDPVKIVVEPFCELPIDKDAFVGNIPELVHTVAFSPFEFFEDKKLLIHNMGHATAAYLGNLKGYTYVWESMNDPEVFSLTKTAMTQVALALEKEYAANGEELSVHVEDLLFRFGNKMLGDTVERVGRDPMRKLSSDDRFTGAVNKCKTNGITYTPILSGIAAALRYQNKDDPSAVQMNDEIQKQGLTAFLQNWCRLSGSDAEKCRSIYDSIS